MKVLETPRTGQGRHVLLGGEAAAIALVTPSGSLTYADLAALVEDRSRLLGTTRRLVMLEAGNDLGSVLTYLAALAGGHPVLLTGPAREGAPDHLLERYDPDVVQRAGATAPIERRPGTRHDLHPDLAVLLSTSGSTGSPKLVRLSRANLLANAASIVDYLGLAADDRAITSLPMHYCYGLSVLNSHLLAGGGVVLSDLSVADDCFWDLARRERVTGLAGVPYTFELLDASGFATRDLPDLRRLTQAGGRMDRQRITAYAELGARRGFELVVMYGQTEATARIAYLPPDRAATRPESIGVPTPGGELHLEPVPHEPRADVGELVYTGPNVMMGYAHTTGDLARGPELTSLRTGDLARQADDGLWEIVGRVNRYAKVFGLRLDLDQVEQELAEQDLPADIVVHGDALWVFTTRARVADRIRDVVTELTGLPAGAVSVHRLEVPSRTANGKTDYRELERHASVLATTTSTTPLANPGSIRDLYAALLGRPDATTTDSFVDLGGDSLSYVEVSTRLGDSLGALPRDWPRRTPVELARLARRRHRLLTPVDSTVLLRALAITMIVTTHADLVLLPGGAHVLLAVAGFNLVRFQLAHDSRAARSRGLVRAMLTFAVPAALWILVAGLINGDYHPATALFLNGTIGADTWTDDWQFWFLEALVWCYAGLAALLAIPAIDRWQRARPFETALLALAVALVARYLWTGIEAGPTERYSTGLVIWCFLLGCAAAHADTRTRRLLVATVAIVATLGFFGDLHREATVVVGVLVLLFGGAVPLPRPLAFSMRLVASASLGIYLTHWQVYPELEEAGHPVLAIVASIAVGVIAWFAWEWGTTRSTQAIRRWRAHLQASTHGDWRSTPTSACPLLQTASQRLRR
ncbi:MAG: AMP-dependent synthetase and ligase [Nocardioides sp.]|nr:AMP-dependent synthetase and ligase [Nocardioides sp.]